MFKQIHTTDLNATTGGKLPRDNIQNQVSPGRDVISRPTWMHTPANPTQINTSSRSRLSTAWSRLSTGWSRLSKTQKAGIAFGALAGTGTIYTAGGLALSDVYNDTHFYGNRINSEE